MFLWLGLFRDAKVFKELIPLGYDNAAFRGIRQLPFELHYTGKISFDVVLLISLFSACLVTVSKRFGLI